MHVNKKIYNDIHIALCGHICLGYGHSLGRLVDFLSLSLPYLHLLFQPTTTMLIPSYRACPGRLHSHPPSPVLATSPPAAAYYTHKPFPTHPHLFYILIYYYIFYILLHFINNVLIFILLIIQQFYLSYSNIIIYTHHYLYFIYKINIILAIPAFILYSL